MRTSPLRRVVSLLVALAFVVGLQAAVVPMPVAASDTVATAMAGHMTSDDCKGCDQQSMAAQECLAVCASAPILPGQAGPVSFAPSPGDWTWPGDKIAAVGVQPDLSPPRS